MSSAGLVTELIALYVIALAAVLALARLRVSATVALIVTGVVCGPSGLGVLESASEVDGLAELGVVLLLFTVGLDFPIGELRRIWKTAVVGGALQVAVTALLVAGVLISVTAAATGLALFVGVFVAMSSTAIVIRALAERNELDAPHGRLAVGVLLFQDLVIVVVLAFLPALAGSSGRSDVLAIVPRILAALIVVALIGRLVLPPLLRFAIRARRREAFPLALLVASVGTAWLCARLGLPTAVGAFLGGFVLAESEFSVQAQAEIRPIRDVLASLFFVSVGMLLDLSLVIDQLPLVLGASTIVIAGKAIAAAAALLALQVPLRVAVATGIGLAQIGEFSVIFGRAGLQAGLIAPATWQTLLSVSLVTMLVTPVLLWGAPAIASAASRAWGPRRPQPGDTTAAAPRDVVILGYGLGGQLIATALHAAGREYLAIDLNGAAVAHARDRGQPVLYGDATNPETLEAAGLARATAVAVVLSDPEATRRAVRAIRTLSATIPVVVRTRYRLEAERLLAAGATSVVVEEIETSLEVLAHLLVRLGLAGNRIEAILDTLRHESIVRPLRAPVDPLVTLPAVLREAEVASHEIELGDWAAGRTIAETHLRSVSGASIVAMGRGDAYVMGPPPHEALRTGDVLYLLGSASVVAAARRLLRYGPSATAV